MTMKPGDHVTWLYIPRGGYGYTFPIDVEIIKLGTRYATVCVQKKSGETVRRRVALSSLRARPPRAP